MGVAFQKSFISPFICDEFNFLPYYTFGMVREHEDVIT